MTKMRRLPSSCMIMAPKSMFPSFSSLVDAFLLEGILVLCAL